MQGLRIGIVEEVDGAFQAKLGIDLWRFAHRVTSTHSKQQRGHFFIANGQKLRHGACADGPHNEPASK